MAMEEGHKEKRKNWCQIMKIIPVSLYRFNFSIKLKKDKKIWATNKGIEYIEESIQKREKNVVILHEQTCYQSVQSTMSCHHLISQNVALSFMKKKTMNIHF